MQVLGSNVLVLKKTTEYKGLIQGVSDNSSTKSTVMSIGSLVTELELGMVVLIDWNKAKNINGDLWLVDIKDVAAIFEGEEELL